MYEPLRDWYSVGCIMLYGECSSFNGEQAHIDANHFEDMPHITILYGIQCDVLTSEVISYIEEFEFGDISLVSEKLDCFQNQLQDDVVVMSILDDAELLRFRKHLMDNIENKQSYDIYRPHITLAYVSEGDGHKYTQNLNKPAQFIPKRIVYCPPALPNDHEEISIPINWASDT